MSGVDGVPEHGAGCVRVSRVQALSHADLFRLLPRLVAPAEVRAGTEGMLARFADGRRLGIRLEPETGYHLGSLRLRSTRFTLEFEGWLESQIRAFLAHCDRSLQQGGG